MYFDGDPVDAGVLLPLLQATFRQAHQRLRRPITQFFGFEKRPEPDPSIFPFPLKEEKQNTGMVIKVYSSGAP